MNERFVPGFQELLHPRAIEALGVVSAPEFLEGYSYWEIRDLLENEYQLRLAPNNRHDGVIVGWGEYAGLPDVKTVAGLVTNDKNALILGLGYDGTYVAQVLSENDGRPTRSEEREVMELIEENLMQYYELTESFRQFLDRVRTRTDVRHEHPIMEWIAGIRERISLLLFKHRRFFGLRWF